MARIAGPGGAWARVAGRARRRPHRALAVCWPDPTHAARDAVHHHRPERTRVAPVPGRLGSAV